MKTLRLKFRNSDESVQIAFLKDEEGQKAFDDILDAKLNRSPGLTVLIPHGEMGLTTDEIALFSIVDNSASEEDILEMRKSEIAFRDRLAKVGLK